MNGEKTKVKVLREITSPWNEIMNIAEQICRTGNGEIIIKIHQGKITLWEYRIKRNDKDIELETIVL